MQVRVSLPSADGGLQEAETPENCSSRPLPQPRQQPPQQDVLARFVRPSDQCPAAIQEQDTIDRVQFTPTIRPPSQYYPCGLNEPLVGLANRPPGAEAGASVRGSTVNNPTTFGCMQCPPRSILGRTQSPFPRCVPSQGLFPLSNAPGPYAASADKGTDRVWRLSEQRCLCADRLVRPAFFLRTGKPSGKGAHSASAVAPHISRVSRPAEDRIHSAQVFRTQRPSVGYAVTQCPFDEPHEQGWICSRLEKSQPMMDMHTYTIYVYPSSVLRIHVESPQFPAVSLARNAGCSGVRRPSRRLNQRSNQDFRTELIVREITSMGWRRPRSLGPTASNDGSSCPGRAMLD